MKPLPRREIAPELLDEPEHDEATLVTSLHHIAQVNRWLGGRAALIRRLPELLPPEGPVRILDVATGSADLPRALVTALHTEQRPLNIVATDLHPQILRIARENSTEYRQIEIRPADALALPFDDGVFDVSLLSLALHHFEGADQMRVLREIGRVSTRGVVVSELERSRFNYLGARLLSATLWRRNPLTRHDGPLSVLRAFTAQELLQTARAAGLRRPRVYRHFFHRLVLLADGGVDAED